MKSTVCHECGSEIRYEPLTFAGREVPPPGICDRCADRMERQAAIEQRRRAFAERLSRSRLPKNRQRVPLPDGPLGDLARGWAEGEIAGLCLTGPVGVGKTHLAAAAAWHRLQRSSVRWVSTARLMSQLRAGFGDDARSEAQEIVTGSGPLILDDLDKVNPTEYGREVLFAAIDNRIEAGSALLVTTNLALGEIGDRLGPAVMSRLAGHCRVVKIDGDDKRLAA